MSSRYFELNKRSFPRFSGCRLRRKSQTPEPLPRDRTRSKLDPIPHISFGKYPRFRWNSPELNEWIDAQLIGTVSPTAADDAEAACDYEYLTSAEVAARLNVPESWVRDQVRARASEPMPHVRFGKYVRFRWHSPELATWADRRMVSGHNQVVSRAPGKETVQ
jgi:hypothetical protein